MSDTEILSSDDEDVRSEKEAERIEKTKQAILKDYEEFLKDSRLEEILPDAFKIVSEYYKTHLISKNDATTLKNLQQAESIFMAMKRRFDKVLKKKLMIPAKRIIRNKSLRHWKMPTLLDRKLDQKSYKQPPLPPYYNPAIPPPNHPAVLPVNIQHGLHPTNQPNYQLLSNPTSPIIVPMLCVAADGRTPIGTMPFLIQPINENTLSTGNNYHPTMMETHNAEPQPSTSSSKYPYSNRVLSHPQLSHAAPQHTQPLLNVPNNNNLQPLRSGVHASAVRQPGFEKNNNGANGQASTYREWNLKKKLSQQAERHPCKRSYTTRFDNQSNKKERLNNNPISYRSGDEQQRKTSAQRDCRSSQTSKADSGCASAPNPVAIKNNRAIPSSITSSTLDTTPAQKNFRLEPDLIQENCTEHDPTSDKISSIENNKLSNPSSSQSSAETSKRSEPENLIVSGSEKTQIESREDAAMDIEVKVEIKEEATYDGETDSNSEAQDDSISQEVHQELDNIIEENESSALAALSTSSKEIDATIDDFSGLANDPEHLAYITGQKDSPATVQIIKIEKESEEEENSADKAKFGIRLRKIDELLAQNTAQTPQLAEDIQNQSSPLQSMTSYETPSSPLDDDDNWEMIQNDEDDNEAWAVQPYLPGTPPPFEQ